MGGLAAQLCRAMFSRADLRRESSRRDYEAEALCAGWVPPLPEPAPAGPRRDLMVSPGGPDCAATPRSADLPEGLLARVYVHQAC